jgi:glycosyltransferase involved in cell wall biosynthesis
VPEVVTVYDMVYERFPGLFKGADADVHRAEKAECIHNATRLIAISEATKKDVCEMTGVPEERVDVIHLAVNTDVFFPGDGAATVRQKYGLVDPYVLYVGARTHYKNFGRLLEALAKPSLQPFSLAVVGEPFDSSEQRMLNALGLAGRTRLIPFPAAANLRAIYQAARGLVYPSLWEGFGLPLLEAMACGTPVAASRAGSLPEVGGDAAVYFDPYNTDEMADSVASLLDSHVPSEYRGRGLRRVGDFSWERTAALTIASYRKALAGAG